MPNFDAIQEATREVVSGLVEGAKSSFDGAQTRPKIPPGARVRQFGQLLNVFGGDTERLIIAVDAKYGKGQGQKYLTEMQRLEKKYRR